MIRIATRHAFFYFGRCYLQPGGWMMNFAFGRRPDAIEWRHYRLYLYSNLFKSWPFVRLGAALDI